MEEHELSTKESRILNNLLSALRNRNKERFQDLLDSGDDINVDYYFGDPDLGTLLDFSCMNRGHQAFVQLLLEHGANPNIVNKRRNKAPLHFAVENNDLETLECLLSCPEVNENILDPYGNCALHYAVKLKDTACLERLLQSKKIDLNIINNKGKSPLLVALLLLNTKDPNISTDVILHLLEHDNLNLDNDPKSAEIKKYLNSFIPNWELYIKPKRTSFKEVSASHCFNLLQNGRYDEFIAIIKSKRDDSEFLEYDNGNHTFLQYCCLFGIYDVVKELLNLNVNPNKATNKTPSTPLMLAARKGFVDIVRILINTDRCSLGCCSDKKETVLHHVVKGSSEESDLVESVLDIDHLECLKLLLTNDKISLNNTLHKFINQGDYVGNTALHYAVRQGENEMVLYLLKKGASISCFNTFNEPAFADINYKTFKKYLDYCVTTNNKLPREDEYEMILDYSFLRPVNDGSSLSDNSLLNAENSESLVNNKSYNTFECKSLKYMSTNKELKYLLKHPIFTSFLYLKWNKIKKCFFVNLFFYFIFLSAMTIYILNVYPHINGDNSHVKKSLYWYFLIFLLVLLIFREVAQVIIAPFNYLRSPENYLEIFIVFTAFIILFSAESTPFDTKVLLSVTSIMLSWSELVLLIGKHPALSTYIEMLKTVSWNFFKFLGWYSTLIIAFALSFYILFGVHDSPSNNESNDVCAMNTNNTDENLFSSPYVSLFKTVIMLTGEFDASSVPFVCHPVLSRTLFIAFLFSIAIVLFNLLNGLAVSDTQAIQSDSELVGYISRVNLIAFFETLVYNPLPNKETTFNRKLSSCWENSFLNYYKNKVTSKFINLFHDGQSNDGTKIIIYPNKGNKVNIDNSYSRDSNSNRRFSIMEMDSSVIHSIKELLVEKHAQKEVEEEEKKKKEKDIEMKRDIDLLKKIVQENQVLLNKLIQKESGGI